MSPIHRPGFESAPAPEFKVSPFVIPSPSRDETRIRNLQAQVPGRLAASTDDLNREPIEPCVDVFVKVDSPLSPHPHERRAQTDGPSALAQLSFQGQQFGGPSSLPSFTASLLLNTTRLYSVPPQPCGEFRTRREHPHRLFTTVTPIQHPRYRARHILKRQDQVRKVLNPIRAQPIFHVCGCAPG